MQSEATAGIFKHSERIGKFTSSEITKLLTGGTRPMTEAELAAEKAAGGRRKTVDITFGAGAMTYIKEKVAEHLTGQAPEEIFTKTVEWGKLMEPDAIAALVAKGYTVEYFGDDNPVFFNCTKLSGGTPDGRCNGDATLEIKCPYTSKEHIAHMMYKSQIDLKEEKEDYYAQLQWNMKGMNLQKGLFVSYDPRMIEDSHKLFILEVYRDETYIKMLEERVNLAEIELLSILNLLEPKKAA